MLKQYQFFIDRQQEFDNQKEDKIKKISQKSVNKNNSFLKCQQQEKISLSLIILQHSIRMDQQQNKLLQIVYAVIHNGERSGRRQAEKQQYQVRTGYVGERYKKVVGENRKYFTTRSVYTRHQEICEKYKYNFDPKQSKTLMFLKRKWNEQLFHYLSQFGKGFYVKKRSAKDKRQFKLQNGFQIKENPLFRMLHLLDKLNYSFLVLKLSHGFKQMTKHNRGKSCQSKANDVSIQQPLLKRKQKLSTISQTTQQQAEQQQTTYSDNEQQQYIKKQSHIGIFKTLNFPTWDKNYMKAYDSYKDQGYRGRSIINESYKKQAKNILCIKKIHRKHLTKNSINKIIHPSGSC